MQQVRPPAVAGSFYPAAREVLSATLSALLAEADIAADLPQPKALIVPHAGYVYSGPVAATAYARLYPHRQNIHRVLLLGPAHRLPFRGIAAPSVDAFETPLGEVAIDGEMRERALRLPQVHSLDEAHRLEHSLEVQLPFLQVLLDDFSLLPLVVGDCPPEQVTELIESLWGGPETLILISSDLSHFLDYEQAQRCDTATCLAIESLEDGRLGYDDACGRLPVSGLLRAAREHQLNVETLDLRNSGDTAGSRDRVVGYGAWSFTESNHAG